MAFTHRKRCHHRRGFNSISVTVHTELAPAGSLSPTPPGPTHPSTPAPSLPPIHAHLCGLVCPGFLDVASYRAASCVASLTEPSVSEAPSAAAGRRSVMTDAAPSCTPASCPRPCVSVFHQLAGLGCFHSRLHRVPLSPSVSRFHVLFYCQHVLPSFFF